MATETVPASIGQRLLAMIGHYRPDLGALNCPVLCRLRGPLDRSALRASLDGLTARHEALRTTFAGRGRGLTQHVHAARGVDITEIDVTAGELDEAIAAELVRPIDVTDWPTRATLWRAGPEDHVLCFNAHHLITDAWSCGLAFTELRSGYGGAVLRPPTWQYRDFVEWQQTLLAGTGLDRQRAYWARQLAGLELPKLPYRTPRPGERPGVVRADLSPAVADGLRALARTHRTTLFTVALAVYYAVLRDVCGQDDLAVASLFANRSRREAQGTVGFLANMVVLRAKLGSAAGTSELVRATHAAVIGAFANQEQPYQTLPLEQAALGAGRADDVVFQMMVDPGSRGTVAGLDFELLLPDGIGSRFGVELALAPLGRGLRAVLFHGPMLAPSDANRLLTGYVSSAARFASASPVSMP